MRTATVKDYKLLPYGAYLTPGASVIFDRDYRPIVRLTGQWPDCDPASAVVVDPLERIAHDRKEFFYDAATSPRRDKYTREDLQDIVDRFPVLASEIERRFQAAERAEKAERNRETKLDRRLALSPKNQAKLEQWKEQHIMSIIQFPQQTPATPPRYLFETISDLRKLPAVKWLVEGWIPEQGVGVVYGPYASGKSFIGFDLLLHLAYGLNDWHGVTLPGGSCDVLLIAREGAAGFRGRVDAFKAHHGITDDNDRLTFMRSPVNFGDVTQFEDLKTAIKATGREFRAVLVDTVGRALPGEDMFDPKSITRFMEHLQQLGEISQGVAIGVHHENKSGDLFGSIYFGASSDFMFQVEREGDPKTTPLVRGKITCTKMKDAADGWKRRVDYAKVADSLVVASIAEAGGLMGDTKKLTDDDKLAFKALGDALKAVGVARPEFPGRSVTIDQWLDYAFKIGGVDPTAAKPKRDLHRRQVKLLANGMILVQDQLVRIINSATVADASLARGGSDQCHATNSTQTLTDRGPPYRPI